MTPLGGTHPQRHFVLPRRGVARVVRGRGVWGGPG
jgi:hypothetical protein